MGMYDEIHCHAELPDGRDPRGTCFQTKSFPDPCMCRYPANRVVSRRRGRISRAHQKLSQVGDDRRQGHRCENQRGLLRNRARSTIAASIKSSAAMGNAVITELSGL
jgi:hypothetical protein